MSRAHAVLTAHDLTIGYPAPRRAPHIVAEHITAQLAAGELVCLVGPNGAGKSTLMRTLAGMQPALAGTVHLGGDDVFALGPRERARRMSVVLTERIDTQNLTAYELVALGRHPYTDWSGRLSERDEAIVRQAIIAVGAQHLSGRHVAELSDGERQKIMIARALAQEPLVMLLDEPTAFLDLPNRVEIMRVLRSLTRHTGRAVLLSTHDLDLALRSADRIWLLPHQGPLYGGAPEDLVLNGLFEATFSRRGVVFDRHTGTFTITTPSNGTVVLKGHGLETLWTRRALEREGFAVVDQTPSHGVIEVIQNGPSSPRWQRTTGDTTQEYNSIGALIDALRTGPESTC